MPTGARRKPQEDEEIVSTGTWESAGFTEESEVVEAEPAAIEPAKFVRLRTMVGKYFAGSVIPTSAFEHIQSIIDAGGAEYDYTATEPVFTGTESERAMIASTERPVAMTIPQAPWINASAPNLLGAHYMPVRPVQRVESKQMTVSEQTLTPEPQF